MTLAEIKSYIFKRSREDATSFAAADMVVQLNASNRFALSLIRDMTDNFLPTDWTTSDLSTGTATPVFDANFHEIIPLRVSYQTCTDMDRRNKADLQDELNRVVREMTLFYGARNYRICTITIASPGVITRKEHKFESGNRVIFSTSGALPTGITVNTWYYVVNPEEETFQISSTKGGTAINTTGSQSGTHWVAGDNQGGMKAAPQDNK